MRDRAARRATRRRAPAAAASVGSHSGRAAAAARGERSSSCGEATACRRCQVAALRAQSQPGAVLCLRGRVLAAYKLGFELAV